MHFSFSDRDLFIPSSDYKPKQFNMPITDMFRPRLDRGSRTNVGLDYGKIGTSEAIASLVRYVEERQNSDMLVTGFDENSGKNPYRRGRATRCCSVM